MQFFKLVAICIFKNQNRIFSTPPFREALVFPILLHVVLLLLTRFTIISNMLVLYNLTMPNSSCFFFQIVSHAQHLTQSILKKTESSYCYVRCFLFLYISKNKFVPTVSWRQTAVKKINGDKIRFKYFYITLSLLYILDDFISTLCSSCQLMYSMESEIRYLKRAVDTGCPVYYAT